MQCVMSIVVGLHHTPPKHGILNHTYNKRRHNVNHHLDHEEISNLCDDAYNNGIFAMERNLN